MYLVEIKPVPIPVKYAVAAMAILETSFESGARGQVLPIPLTEEERTQWDPEWGSPVMRQIRLS